jgi:phosphate starvation-inducible PhoH-like protein
VVEVLKGVKGIGFTHFLSKDVVRHPLVQRIVEAYDAFDSQQEELRLERQQAREDQNRDKRERDDER